MMCLNADRLWQCLFSHLYGSGGVLCGIKIKLFSVKRTVIIMTLSKFKCKVFLVLVIKHQAMKAYGGVEV
jgi:hypothetical protein